MKRSNTFLGRTLILAIIVLSLVAISVFGMVACGEKEDSKPNGGNNDNMPNENGGSTSNDILPLDGTYKLTGMQDKVGMHPENFGDTLIVEKSNGIYYVTIEILNNAKVERLYWSGRKNSMTTDAKIVVNGSNTKYMFAFDDEHVQKKLDFKIGGGKMPLDPPFGFKIEFDKLVKVSDTVADVERPVPFL